MSDYFNKTEEQEFNDVKKWFQENGTPILVVICAISLSIFGWKFWKNHQLQATQQASANYQAVMESYSKNPSQNQLLVDKFITENKDTSYAVFSALELAKQQVEAKEFTKAQTILQNTLTSTEDATLQNIIRLRLAMVDYQLNQLDDALSLLSQVEGKAWNLRKQILTGDILVAKGDITAAKSAYQQAKENAPINMQSLIDMRVNNL
ncbi:tetratricopeptide repeat protein [Pasteurella skyensis]|uniref:Ancillary SecYEG translocon subunit n=1 Tax=Phocoenobacter skyensis TaxID=97481 RepID=A0AAJ6N8P3_9PAST|nr:tetratricopeptide repeat protein [Pasteurella skyensis]MDP8162065.1 tetratricopeptide repeat protein [Pasteurella skyensis]MDP8172221.1 tetratricopeptide repeat protein [Pasteurella skyensis]MDP8176430.1 tetratricopeptide repeat protein [Pasteurella skyensis]MDP8178319.1 tetratricopeptide repeat protein [Pasteurella skyensis]MDP8182925.1 tetratricopeptide repeat protein [Pasteurella skyensis]